MWITCHVHTVGNKCRSHVMFTLQGADVNHTSDSGRTALWKAAQGGYREMVRYLHEQGASVNSQNKVGASLLYEMARQVRGYIPTSDVILNRNKKVLLRESKRHTARRVASARSAALSPGWVGGTPSSTNGRGITPYSPDGVYTPIQYWWGYPGYLTPPPMSWMGLPPPQLARWEGEEVEGGMVTWTRYPPPFPPGQDDDLNQLPPPPLPPPKAGSPLPWWI